MPTAHLEHDNASPEILRNAELIAALQHVIARFGSGVRLENEAKLLGERLGIALDVQIENGKPALVH